MNQDQPFVLGPVGCNTQFEYFFIDQQRVKAFYDKKKLERDIRQAVESDGLEVMSYAAEHFHDRQDRVIGITAFAVLNCSDMNIHTTQEHGSAQGRVYSCKAPDSGILAERVFRDRYEPDIVIIRRNLVVADLLHGSIDDVAGNRGEAETHRIIRVHGQEEHVFETSTQTGMERYLSMRKEVREYLLKERNRLLAAR